MKEKALEVYGLPIGNRRKSKINVYKNHIVTITGEEFQLLWLCFNDVVWDQYPEFTKVRGRLIRKFHKGF